VNYVFTGVAQPFDGTENNLGMTRVAILHPILVLTVCLAAACGGSGDSTSQTPMVPSIPTPAITTSSLAVAAASLGYSQPVQAAGGSNAGYTWSVIRGALPPGIFLRGGTPTATLMGVPTVIGTFQFTLQVRDSNGQIGTRDLAVEVKQAIITTVAGTGVKGYSGDGGLATAAQLNNPWGVATDTAGNLLIADRGNHRIRRVNIQSGIINTIAGTGLQGSNGDGGLATAAELSLPSNIALDSLNNLFIADQGNNRIRQVNAQTGIITTVAGTGSQGCSGPTCFSGDGGAAITAQLWRPWGVSWLGVLNIADTENHRVRQVDAQTGIITTVAGTGHQGYSGDGSAATGAQLFTPLAVAVDAGGNLFIADTQNHRIRRVDFLTGVITTVAGNGVGGFSGDGGPATASALWNPSGVAIDGAGNLLIVDQFNNRIRLVNAQTGIITTVAGTGVAGFNGDNLTATAAQLWNPSGITIDTVGNLLIVDSFNNRIRRVGP
jgi:hypothetical protein